MVEFAINSSISASTGLAPFEANNGYMPSMLRTMEPTDKAPLGVRAFALQAVRNMATAHDSIIAARVFQRHAANAKRRKEPSIKKDDLVYLSTDKLSMPKGRAGKLLPKFVGPYRVLEANPSTSNYLLELPEELKRRRIHPRFHVGRL